VWVCTFVDIFVGNDQAQKEGLGATWYATSDCTLGYSFERYPEIVEALLTSEGLRGIVLYGQPFPRLACAK